MKPIFSIARKFNELRIERERIDAAICDLRDAYRRLKDEASGVLTPAQRQAVDALNDRYFELRLRRRVVMFAMSKIEF